jgi:hypothetical protein
MVLADSPTPTYRENLAHEAIGSVTAKVSRKFSVFPCGDKTAQWYLAFQSFLKARISLNLFREVGRVIYEVLRDRVKLDVMLGKLNADRLNVCELRTSCRAVGRCPAYATKRRGASDQQDLAVASSNHVGYDCPNKPGQRVDHHSEGLLPFGIGYLHGGRARCWNGKICDKDVNCSRGGNEALGCARL